MVLVKRISLISLILVIFSSCEPISKIHIETIKPASKPIPYFAKSVSFINLENDINNDSEDDSIIVNTIYNEFLLGVNDIVNKSPRINLNNIFSTNNYLSKDLFYDSNNNIKWDDISKLETCNKSDIVYLLDSIYIVMEENKTKKVFYYDHYEYYKYRKFFSSAYFTALDLKHKKIIERYNHKDTLLWENMNADINIIENNFPDIKKSLKIFGYWLGYDYAARVFPFWVQNDRILYVTGNRDFKKAANLFNENKFNEASKIWNKYINYYDKEIVARAYYNLALVSEMNGKLDNAIEYLIESYKIKQKDKTKLYILQLQKRRIDNKKLKYQLP